MLPVINKESLTKGAVAALALNCQIAEISKFDRKNYFYPDSPKGFQISQFDKPISTNGYVEILAGGKLKKIRVNRLHLEDDAGKLVHVSDGTLCDYNRSGTPLMEIVSEPDLRSVEEASEYAQELRRILRYVGSSDCDMEKGMMRFDINISMRKKGEAKLGVKAEVKNVNSFRALERALDFEIKRQTKILEEGGKVLQETRGWDDAKGETVSQRSKEEAHDYRYFPEPDLPPILMKKADVEAMKKLVPELPMVRRQRFVQQYGLTEEDAGILTEERAMADYFETVTKVSGDAKKSVSFINTILLKHLHAEQKAITDCKIKPEQLGQLVKMVNDGTVSNNMAKTEIFEEMYKTGETPEAVMSKKGLKLVSDTGALEGLAKKVIDANPGPVADFKAGKQQALGFLVGKIMQESKGQANPKVANDILRKLLQ
jgi:aspartyl-tRNA(Asn)/glutamyl-tRNA(Gln) amidotransferase subunit B